MDIGMLWYDNETNIALDKRIERAVCYYQKKYGESPTVCYLHPSMLPVPAPSAQTKDIEELRFSGVVVRATKSILPNHFWIGVNGV